MRKYSFFIFQCLVVGIVVWFSVSAGIGQPAPGSNLPTNYAPIAVGIWIAYLLTIAIIKIQDWLKRRRLNP